MTKLSIKPLGKWTKKEFEALPERKWNEDIGEFDCMVIMPTKHIHSSGFRQMDFVAVKDMVPICKLSGCSDIIHIEGIGGYGKDWLEKFGTIPESSEIKSWNIDCLRKSGLLVIFCYNRTLTAGNALSSFEIYSNSRTV